ncbi:hypothetical protein RM553_17105 [Zunongwangia sp. F363]|uniref:Lipocalin-like domain-containing protein n=1 Tax=Autumnicola tepida TaxID=3075595 RepID=A0ABU3CEB6_9FLAO|nr:hypothetical protein [Zunongwangia sp. F363]MDT0644562.1 hypothetical protein [Zunongwangia sp. F363]
MKRLLSLITILVLLSCSNDDDTGMPNNEEVPGVWETSYEINNEDYPDLEDGDYEYVLQFEFFSDGTFESHTFLRDISNNAIQGYNVQMKGNFTTEGDRMNLIYDQWNSNTEASQFVSLDDLSLIQEDVEWSFDFSVEDEELLFDFDPCGPLEYCADELTLERVTQAQ